MRTSRQFFVLSDVHPANGLPTNLSGAMRVRCADRLSLSLSLFIK